MRPVPSKSFIRVILDWIKVTILVHIAINHSFNFQRCFFPNQGNCFVHIQRPLCPSRAVTPKITFSRDLNTIDSKLAIVSLHRWDGCVMQSIIRRSWIFRQFGQFYLAVAAARWRTRPMENDAGHKASGGRQGS
jgi:hypothetical protein